MSPTAVQSRIAAFEAYANQNAHPSPKSKQDPPNLAHKSSLIDLADWVLDDMPPSPNLTPPQLQLQLSSPPRQKPKPKPKPPALQMRNATSQNKNPPLPPRKSTIDSAASDTSFLYPPLGGREALTGENGRRGSHATGSSISSFHSVSLSSDTGTDPETPGASMIATYPIDRIPSGSSSCLGESFEEISIPPTPLLQTLAKQRPQIPQRPTTMPPPMTTPPAQQSHTSPPTPTPLPYVPRRVPPPPPATSRGSDRSSIQSLGSSVTNSGSSASGRSGGSAIQTPTLLTTLSRSPTPSILSPSSATSSLVTSAASAKLKRPTPVPSAARKRYTAVFNANILQRRSAELSSPSSSTRKPKKLTHSEAKATRTRQAAGWRGLSVDLITATPEELELADAKGKEKNKELSSERNLEGSVGPDDRLEASIVKLIWSRSRVEKSKLAEIWSDCDPDSRGSLDLDSFVRGMWRIDEYLRRTQAQTTALRNASSTSLTTLRSGLGSLKIKSGQPNPGRLHRSTSRSSLGTTSLSRSSSVNSRLNGYANYPPPPPVPKIILR